MWDRGVRRTASMDNASPQTPHESHCARRNEDELSTNE